MDFACVGFERGVSLLICKHAPRKLLNFPWICFLGNYLIMFMELDFTFAIICFTGRFTRN